MSAASQTIRGLAPPRLRAWVAGVLPSVQLLGESRGVSIPAGSDPAPYKQLGMSMSRRAWAKRVQGVSFAYVSAIDLGRGWYLTTGHSVVGSRGTAMITEVGNGIHPISNPGQGHAVTEQHLHPEFVPSYISGGFSTVDACLVYAPTANDHPIAIIGEKPQNLERVICKAYELLATQVEYINSISASGPNQRFWVGIVHCKILLDRREELGLGVKHAAPDSIGGQVAKEALHQFHHLKFGV